MDLAKYLTAPAEQEELKGKSTRTVTKRDGTAEAFNESKLERWAMYAAKFQAVSWGNIVDKVKMRLPMNCTTDEIHQTMIQVCLDEENIEYSRVAARLLYGELRKNMNLIGVHDKDEFSFMHTMYSNLGIWTFKLEDIEWADKAYKELIPYYLEYWQIRQWMDKYSLQYKDLPVENPHAAIFAMAISIHGETQEAIDMAHFVLQGLINLPTPVLNGCRNGDFDSISCSVIHGADTVDSIGVATHLAYKMTAKKAGVGIRFDTRSVGDDVKGGRVKHLGKAPIYATVDKAIKMFTQVTRGGSATVTYSVYDPEIIELLNLKSQKTPENKRIDKLDYSLAYDNNFIEAVKADEAIPLTNILGEIKEWVSAREVLKAFLTVRQDTGRVYCINLDTANHHTPFKDYIFQSNLCMEIALPTYPFDDMEDLYSEDSTGEMAFCTLSAINVGSKYWDDAPKGTLYEVAVLTLNRIIDKVGMFSPSLKAKLEARRSLGVGITGLAGWLHANGLYYANSDSIEELCELHYLSLLHASQAMVTKYKYKAVEGIDPNWLPIDTKSTNKEPKFARSWESIRGKPRANSVLVAHMPTESSAIFSNATNGVYPVRNKVINKQSRKGAVQYLAPDVAELAWDIPTPELLRAYAAIQAYTDQSISADTYVVPNKYEGGKVPMSTLMKEFVGASQLGMKTLYYVNTLDVQESFHDQADDGCSTCKL